MSESYEGFYEGGVSALDPDFGNLTGYNINAAMLGFPGSPQSANQVQDVVNAIKHGTKTFEVTMLQPDVGESIPEQHFEEMRALMKLTGVKPSVHGPIIDSVGFGEQGWGKEEGRQDNERRMFEAIRKAQKLDSSGKLPIVFHATNGTPGNIWRPGEKEGERILESGAMVNMETGQVQSVKREEKWRPESFSEKAKKKGIYGKAVLHDVETSVDSANLGDWMTKLTEVSQMNKHAEELIGAAPMNLAEYKNTIWAGDKILKLKQDEKGNLEFDKNGNPILTNEEMPPIVNPAQKASYEQLEKADTFLENAELSFKSAFGQAYKYARSDKQKDELEKLAKDYTKELTFAGKTVWGPHEKKVALDKAILKLKDITTDRIEKKNGKIEYVDGYGIPQVFKLTEDLALEEASKTFGNLAAKSYSEFKEKAPVLAIENPLFNQALSSADSLKKLVEKSRENFVGQLVEKGVSKKKAEKLAKEKIGVTWDVGHLNLVRSKGFDDKEILRQTKLISGTGDKKADKSMVKHVHLTDNFGYADTHLVPGMGNVPVKAILEELERTGRFDEMRKITEAGGIIQHFKKLPHSMTLAALGSPIYGMKNAPYWNQAVELQGSYFGGYGTLNPQTHHSYFGAGFTTMPVELGGAMPGGQSRFGGTPMA